MPASTLLFSLLLRPGPPPYSATVVDATTNQSLAGVSVRSPAPGAAVASTDERGRFTLATAPRALDLSHLGYAPLHLTLPTGQEAAAGADILRLLPQAYALAEVAVCPPRPYVLVSVTGPGAELGRVLYPGQAVALPLARPADAPIDQPCVVSEVHLWLCERPRQGHLRVRLVEVLPGPRTAPVPGTCCPPRSSFP